jgi:hypothetical protein
MAKSQLNSTIFLSLILSGLFTLFLAFLTAGITQVWRGNISIIVLFPEKHANPKVLETTQHHDIKQLRIPPFMLQNDRIFLQI